MNHTRLRYLMSLALMISLAINFLSADARALKEKHNTFRDSRAANREAQQRMDESRVDELQSELDFLNTHSYIQRIDGSLLVRYNVEVE